MNICFYTDYAISPMTGGIGRVTSILTNYFRNNFGWKVFNIYAFSPKADCQLTDTDDSIQLRLHDRLNIRRDVKANIRKAALFLNTNDIDVLYIQTSLDVVAKLQPFTSARIISVLHFEPGRDEWPWTGSVLAPVRNWLIHRATVKAYRSAYLRGTLVGVLSPYYINIYKEYAGLEETSRLFALPNPLSFADARQTEKKNVALVVARMEDKQKRISHLLDIWKQTDTEGWQLKIVGDGPSLQSYKEKAQQEGLTNISFEGRQNPVPYYQEARLFLMTSSFEGFPMTLVEAQQFGCLPIAYNAFTALTDVLTNNQNGIIIENNNSQAYSQALSRLMHDSKELERMSRQAIQDCQRFSQDVICQRWKEILEQ